MGSEMCIRDSRNITQGTSSKQTFTHAEFQTMVAEQVKAFLSNHNSGVNLATAPPLGSNKYGGQAGGGRNGRGSGSGEYSRKRPSDSGDGRPQKTRKRLKDLIANADDHCMDCGSKTHKRGSDDCKSMSWGTKKIRESKKNDADGDADQVFRGGSSR